MWAGQGVALSISIRHLIDEAENVWHEVVISHKTVASLNGATIVLIHRSRGTSPDGSKVTVVGLQLTRVISVNDEEVSVRRLAGPTRTQNEHPPDHRDVAARVARPDIWAGTS